LGEESGSGETIPAPCKVPRNGSDGINEAWMEKGQRKSHGLLSNRSAFRSF
jgi:hypothetical protein